MTFENKNIDFLSSDLTIDLYNLYKKSSYLAIDTEAMGLIHGRDRLCLVQICNEFKRTSCIKIELNTSSSPHLKALLEDEKITKIFHYGRADIAHIKYYLKTDTNNILDTKIASKLARSYSDNHSLKGLIKEFLNIDISKQFQSSDFGGNLTPSQLKYCANDVIHLHKIHEELKKILERENRIELYKNCLKFLKTRVDLDLALFKDDIWSH